jgi:hypothetical protein
MKAFVVTVLAPDDWTKTDIVTSMHMGMKSLARDKDRDLQSLDYHAMCHTDFKLKDRDNL